MAEVGGMLASAVLKVVTQQIGSAIGGQIKLQQNFNDDLEKMKTTLESVEAVLMDAELRSVKDAAVRLWLKRLKNAMYDISDMIDEFEADTTKPAARKLAVKIPHLTIVPKIAMARKMKMMRDKLKEITTQHQSFRFTADSSSSEKQVNDKRATSSYVEEPLIVGRTKDKQKLLEFISESIAQETMVQRMTILPIYGIGGIGKTTLAKLVFNHTQFKDYCQVWIYVSQTFDLSKIGNSIISQVSKNESQLTDRQMIHNCLGELLAGRKILIVLDDLWENDAFLLEELKAMLKVGNVSMVIVVVTTRDEGIAKKICTVEPYKLEPLTDDMCWTIIKQKSAFEERDDTERLEQIGREIAIKCGGVALAAQSLGYMLQSMKFDEWVSVRNSDIWKESSSEDASLPHHNVLASLLLSYSSMPSYLKLCFSYCAIFPKGRKIVKHDLIHQWIALGFIEPSSIFSSRQLSESYLKQLLGMSFLQHAKSPLTAGLHDEDVMFTMHDLVHDVARSVMVDEVLDTSKDDNIGASSHLRYALLTDCSKPLELFATLPAKMRVLRFLDCAKIELNGAAFSSAKCLRVLDLSKCVIQKLPCSIGKLKQLRYLNAPGVQDRIIPKCITKLSKLSYLNLRGSAISTLPESIGEMEGLMCLDLLGCLGIGKLPESFGDLKNLVHLDLSKCSSVTGVTESLGSLTSLQYLNLSYCRNIGELPGALGSLTELQYLNLSCSSYLVGRSDAEVLGTLTKLEYLNLSSEFSDLKRLPEALCSFTELNYLNLSGCCGIEELPKSFRMLKNLVHLDLSHCHQVKGIPEALGGLTKLRYLNLSHCCSSYGAQSHLRGLPEVMGNLTELRYLNLSKCLDTICDFPPIDQSHSFIECISTLSNLEHLDLSMNTWLCTIPESLGSLRKLHTLDITDCYFLRRLPASIGQIDGPKFIIAENCQSLDKSTLSRFHNSSILLPHFVVRSGDDESSSNLVLLQNANPTDLEICSLENVKSPEEAQRIKLLEKQRILELKFDWTRDAKRSVEDMEVLRELVPPSTLKQFNLRGYISVSFPAWLMDIAHYLPNLVSIKMEDLPKCNSLPPLGQLPNLRELVLERMHSITKIGGDFCGGASAFPRLNAFRLCSMENLEEWNTTYHCGEDGVNEFIFPDLHMLDIHDCPKLRLKPRPPRATLRWWIRNSDNVISSWGERDHSSASSSSPVTNLEVESCKVPLHQWRLLHHLPALPSLSISFCHDLTSSPAIMQDLSSLQSLSLDGNDQAELPYWLGQLTALWKLEISSRYPELKASQENIRHLTLLQSLRLSSCASMKSLPQWLGDLTSLQELDISDCPKLNNLQESMRQLTLLQSLYLGNCRSIQALPEGLGGLTSLRKLEICSCGGIKSLPESIQQLTKLEELRISGCPELEQWCELAENNMKLVHIKQKRIS